ncbi:MAG: helix-turn-helix domain-containing protein [Zhenhengia sp.]|uniref:helix-turn-helix domain-containing protein n=1 Tax=Zhenhengia sp. TaxID=2944208 RepID=UPI003995C1C0
MRVTNNIIAILEQQGKTIYWLAKECDMKYESVHRLANNKTESIKFENMASICTALGCTLNDLFTISD